MASTTPQLRCRLCDDTIDAVSAPIHLRWVHEVLPGEPTMADVPVGGMDRALSAEERDFEERRLVASA
jgi:hypothetical protein